MEVAAQRAWQKVRARYGEPAENPSGAANRKRVCPQVDLDGIAGRYHGGGMSTYPVERAHHANQGGTAGVIKLSSLWGREFFCGTERNGANHGTLWHPRR